jgi:uncharacterized pyridoxamine 5'-phosphate oxidase family protein
MERLVKFLKEAKFFYFATSEEGQSDIRPFGFVMIHDGRLFFGMGNHKNVYKQLQKNPKFAVCASKDGAWVRLRAEAGLDVPEAAVKAAFEYSANLSDMYNKESGLTFALVEAKSGTVEFNAPQGSAEKYSL